MIFLPACTMNITWSSYDPLGESYASVAEPAYFAAPADDLVSLLGVSRGVRLLDVGAGTGAVTSAASRVVGQHGLIIALDPAVTMLRMAGKNLPHVRTVAGALPSIPCRAGTFNVVTAAFVLSHVPDPEAALREMARVLTPEGQVGVSSWAASPALTPPAQVWQAVVEKFIDSNRLQQALEQALPSEARLTTPLAIMAALANAGFREASVEQRGYDIRLTSEAFVQSRLLALPSRFMRSALPKHSWEQFVSTASRKLIENFGPQMAFTVTVNLATAIRAA